jgi:N-acetylglucosamine kinase-like BadF-type ATPase
MGAVVGIDIGGSKTAARRVEDGRVVAQAVGASANLESVTAQGAAEVLSSLARSLGSKGVDVVVAGTAGGMSQESRAPIVEMLRATFPRSQVRVVHDTELLLPAGGLDAGVAVIGGTGSVAFGVTSDGRQARAGGWGYLLGDEGSGYWLGREAVRHTLAARDAGAARDDLARRVLEATGCADPIALLSAFYQRKERRYWADLAAHVIDASDTDPECRDLTSRGADALVGLVLTVTHALGGGLPVLLCGGLLQHRERYAALVTAGLAAQGISDVRVLTEEPVTGAVRLAEALAGQ